MVAARRLVPVAACALALLLAHHPMIFSGLARVQTDPVDPRLINYLLEHSYRWLTRQPFHREFWNPPFFYPARNVAAYSDVLLSVAPLYWAGRGLGLDPETGFQLWMMSLSVFNFAAGYALLRRGFELGPLAALVGALLFTSGAPRVNQLGHPQLLPQFFSALVILAIIRAAGASRRGAAGWLCGAAVGIVAQLYASFYLGWFLIFALGLATFWAVGSAVLRRSMRVLLARHALALGGALVCGGVLLAPLLTHYLRAAGEVGPRGLYEVGLSVPDLRAWIYLGPDSWLYGWMPDQAAMKGMALEPEKRLGLGLLTPLVCAWGLRQGWSRPAVRLVTGAGLLLALAVTMIPRTVIVGIALALLADCGVELVRTPRRWMSWGAFVGLCLVLFPVGGLLIATAWVALVVLAAYRLGMRRRLAGVAVGLWLLFLTLAAYPDAAIVSVAVLGSMGLATLPCRERSSIAVAGLGFAVAACLVVYPGHYFVWNHVYQFVPGGAAIRAVARAGLLLLIPASIGLAFCIQTLAARGRPVVGVALVLACLMEQGLTTPSFDKRAEHAVAAAIAARIPPDCGAFLYSPLAARVPYPRYQLDAMWAGLLRRVPTVNGYSGNYPPGWKPLAESSLGAPADERRVGKALADWARLRGLKADRLCWVKGAAAMNP
jgi:hypothetical protein